MSGMMWGLRGISIDGDRRGVGGRREKAHEDYGGEEEEGQGEGERRGRELDTDGPEYM